MSSGKFQEFAENLHLKTIGENAYGFIGEFPIVMRDRSKPLSHSKVVTVTFTLENADSELKKEINRKLPKRCYASFRANYLIVEMTGPYNSIAERYSEMSKAVQDTLSSRSVSPMQSCPICQKSGGNSIVAYDKGYHIAHDHCVRNLIDKVHDKVEDNKENGNYMLGFIGGLAGGVIACIPNLLTIWFFERVFYILYALIPLAIYKGYSIMKGKLSKVVTVYTIAMSIILAVGMDFVIFIGVRLSQGYKPEHMTLLLRNPVVLMEILRTNMYSLVFIAVGIYIAWKRINRTSDTIIKTSGMVKETMRPYENFPL